MHVLPYIHVFRINSNTPKACIVGKGLRQVHKVDYGENYAPVVTLAAYHVFLSIIVNFELECDQMDFITAFLNGDIDEDIYIEVPAVFEDSTRPKLVRKL